MSSAAIILQARITSSRLKNKVLKKINGKTIIEIMISRLKFSRFYNSIIVAIPNNKKNLHLYEFLKKKGINVQKGSENNVLDRYYQIAKKNKIKNIIRLTSDCPLVDYKIVERLSQSFFKKKLNHITTSSNFAEGLDCEMFDFNTLKKIHKKAKLKSEKEHVTLFIKNNKKIFKTDKIEPKFNQSKYRFTLDESNDFIVIKKIIKKFPQITKNEYISSEKIVNFLEKNKKINQINSNIIRNEGLLKSYKKDGIKILFLSQLKKKIGTGNTIRLINYAKLLNLKEYSMNLLVNTDNKKCFKHLDIKNFDNRKFIYNKTFSNLSEYVINYIKKNNIKILVADLFFKDNLYNNQISNFYKLVKQNCNVKIISVGDFRSDNLNTDFLIIPQHTLRNINKKKNYIYGLNCFPFSKNLKQVRENKKINEGKKILIFISGTDPLNVSQKILSIIKSSDFINYKIKIIVSDNFNKKNYENIIQISKNQKNIDVEKFDKNNFHKLFRWSNLNIVGEGLITIESIFSQTPTLIIKMFDNKYSNFSFLKLMKAMKISNFTHYKNLNSNILKQKIIETQNQVKMKKYFKNNNKLFKNYKKFNFTNIVEQTLSYEI